MMSKWTVLLLIIFTLFACSEVLVKTQQVRFEVAEKANKDHPITVEFLLIHDEELLKQISPLTASDWFKKRTQLKQDYPNTLFTWEWEIVPGQKNIQFEMPSSSKHAKGALLFANYITEGEHRITLSTFQAVTVRFLEEEMVVQQPTEEL